MRAVLVSMVVTLATTGSALAATPVVPSPSQRSLKALLAQIGAPDLALVPTTSPAHFAFESYSVTATPVGLGVAFADQRFMKNASQARVHEIAFDTSYFTGALASCSSRSRKTLRVGSSTVYSDGTSVWRCVRTSRGRIVRESAHGHLAVTALATLVVSARPAQ